MIKKRFIAYIAFLIYSCTSLYIYAATEYKPLGFEGVDRPEVQTLKTKYMTTHKSWLYGVLDEAEVYRIHVRKQLEQRNMPAILEYLPVVESNYIPTAKSKSGAAGMWQFMLNSIKPYLHYNEYVDERLDPWKSTDAALQKLNENYKMFGDWLIAITAYNCGAGAMKRMLKQSVKKDFWSLLDSGRLSQQAGGYVPKLLAIADLAENCLYYEIALPTARDANGSTLKIPTESYDYITVKGKIQLKYLAEELRIEEEILENLNLALVKKHTPPHSEYKLRLPRGMEKTARYVLEKNNISTID